jgi:hypothetical protein
VSQAKPERVSVEEILNLVVQLTPVLRSRITCDFGSDWDDSLDRGEGIPAEEVFRQLKDRNTAFRENGK